MIKFKGKITKLAYAELVSRERKMTRITGNVLAATVLCVVLILTFTLNKVMLIGLMVAVTLVILSFIPFKVDDDVLPDEIEIDVEEEMIYIETGGHTVANNFEKIDCVIAENDFYLVKFKFPHKYVICQKDLLVEGTIEEFEKLFEGKIVRKIKEERL